ncbi:MAG: Crp/Fnr family transcriptional regulator, partial [Methylobacter sp.]
EEFHLFPDTDRAMEWCENKLLSASNHVDEGSSVPTLSDFALFSGLEASDCNALSGLLQEFSYSNGTVIVNAGACHDTRIFLLLSGEVSVLVTVNQDQTQRLATLGPGMSFGEVVILGQTYRTATVLADSNVKCWVLQATDLDRLADTRPKMKITILNNLAVLLAEKLKQANGMVAVLAK